VPYARAEQFVSLVARAARTGGDIPLSKLVVAFDDLLIHTYTQGYWAGRKAFEEARKVPS